MLAACAPYTSVWFFLYAFGLFVIGFFAGRWKR